MREDEEYEKVKDLEDTELTVWQRQIKVNKFMVELGVREKIAALVTPVANAQKYLQDQLETQMVSKIDDMEKRFTLLEQHVYGKEGPETRFEIIEER